MKDSEQLEIIEELAQDALDGLELPESLQTLLANLTPAERLQWLAKNGDNIQAQAGEGKSEKKSFPNPPKRDNRRASGNSKKVNKEAAKEANRAVHRFF